MISIITPVRNGAKFIKSCLDNVIQQGCFGVEHLIIDGGSSDQTIDIVKRYARNHDHIRWISEKDSGQSDAMNKGIAMATGDIIGFLNVDDFYEAKVLNRISGIVKTISAPALLVGNCKLWDDSGQLIAINKPSKLKLSDLVKGHRVNEFPVNPSAYFYHKSLHEKIGYYDINDHNTMDIDFLLRAVQVASINYFDEVWGNFRLIKGTKTYSGMKNGQIYKRDRQLCLKYRFNPTIFHSLYNLLLYEYQNRTSPWIKYNFKRLIYFIRKPKEFFNYLAMKIVRR